MWTLRACGLLLEIQAACSWEREPNAVHAGAVPGAPNDEILRRHHRKVILLVIKLVIGLEVVAKPEADQYEDEQPDETKMEDPWEVIGSSLGSPWNRLSAFWGASGSQNSPKVVPNGIWLT